MNSRSVLGVLGTAAATIALVAGCSGPSGSPDTASTSPAAAHNAADTAFVQGMIPHHAQAIQMSEMATRMAGDEEVRQLATRIQRAQGPEIEQMRGLLAAWGEPETGSMGGMDHGDPGMGGMGGMASDQQMGQLGRADATSFDRMFLQMMTEHHNGAIEMAETELAEGRHPDARALAQKIIEDQRAEIVEMQELLSAR